MSQKTVVFIFFRIFQFFIDSIHSNSYENSNFHRFKRPLETKCSQFINLLLKKNDGTHPIFGQKKKMPILLLSDSFSLTLVDSNWFFQQFSKTYVTIFELFCTNFTSNHIRGVFCFLIHLNTPFLFLCYTILNCICIESGSFSLFRICIWVRYISFLHLPLATDAYIFNSFAYIFVRKSIESI